MPLSKPLRWSLIVIGVVVLLVFGPVALIVTGNAGGGILNRQPTMKELTGSYQYRAAWGRASLQLNSNGTFVEDIHQVDKTPRAISGVWQASPKENYLDVEFQPFIAVNDTDHERLNGNSGMPFFTPRSGKPYGVVDDDLGERFKQQ